MKNFYTIIFLLSGIFLHAQIVNIPDSNFKNALLEADVDTNNDGEIQVSEAEVVLSLNMNFKDISSMEGIQSFVNLEVLQCYGNQLTNLDLSGNLNLRLLVCSNNQLSSLDVTQNLNLRTLHINNNQISELNVSQNLILEDFSCGNNQLTSLDVTQNINLEMLDCSNNHLTNLYMNNGNNHNIILMTSIGNTNLSCIQVDDESIPYACGGFPVKGWCKDDWAFYSEDCSLSLIGLESNNISIYPNPVKNKLYLSTINSVKNIKLKIFNIEGKPLGNKNLEFEKQPFINVYKLKSGIYFLNIEEENGKTTVKKFLKE